MARPRTSITMYRGDSYPIAFTISYRINSNTTAPIDLTGCSLLMTVDTLENPPDNATKMFDVAGVLADDPTTGIVYFTPTALNTSAIGSYYFDVQLTDADGNIRTVAKDKFVVSQDITK